MKECEKQWKKQNIYNSHTVSNVYRNGWRSALEWALKIAKELDKQDASICMNDVINQELGKNEPD